MSDFWHGLVNYKPKKTMKAIIEIELGNSAFGSNDAERLFEMRNVLERLLDNADRIMAADVGDFTTAQDGNGNTVATLNIVEAKLPSYHCARPRYKQNYE